MHLICPVIKQGNWNPIALYLYNIKFPIYHLERSHPLSNQSKFLFSIAIKLNSYGTIEVIVYHCITKEMAHLKNRTSMYYYSKIPLIK